MRDGSQHDDLLTPNEVAAIFRVNPKTVTRWAQSGKISAIRTLGGHRRFSPAQVKRPPEEERLAWGPPTASSPRPPPSFLAGGGGGGEGGPPLDDEGDPLPPPCVGG